MGIFVMVNNFFHDFAVGLLFASLLVVSHIHKAYGTDGPEERIQFLRGLYGTFKKVILGCWVVIIAGGVVRTLAYREYEWMEAAGRGQTGALVIKHIILVALVVWGVIIQVRLKKRLTAATG